ncbi:hypothetical protein [Haloarcula argentinensis]|uniref:Uncharacterized protein n=1 Tax=Haloarcula argentinensis TaxID=43776 RepID=A0ABU2EY97_HALAR|nr:hypothetical protein [Haloarcula argentinensis]MDS0253254.1 hypothetical protein [Haloarcula argentinensis]
MNGWECLECDAQSRSDQEDVEDLVDRAREVHEQTTGHRTVSLGQEVLQ